MVSKQVTKIIQNLEKKKFREKYNLFKVEGDKLVRELLASGMEVEALIARKEWLERNPARRENVTTMEAEEREIKALSNFQSLPEVLALAHIPAYRYDARAAAQGLALALNGIQDPGNLGTILRVADWFGVRTVLCDNGCASAYNPKSVQASMGAVFRVRTHRVDLPEALRELQAEGATVYGTFLRGENLYSTPPAPRAVVVMGNEGNGIEPAVEALADKRLTIPSFAGEEGGSESLNVGVAAGIVLSEFRRHAQ